MALEEGCLMFVQELLQAGAAFKTDEELMVVANGIPCKLSFLLLQRLLPCIRGSQHFLLHHDQLTELPFSAKQIDCILDYENLKHEKKLLMYDSVKRDV